MALGNIYFNNLDMAGRYEKHIGYARQYYMKVLKLQPYNLYAANGVGIILAERRFLEEAKEIFVQVKNGPQHQLAVS